MDDRDWQMPPHMAPDRQNAMCICYKGARNPNAVGDTVLYGNSATFSNYVVFDDGAKATCTLCMVEWSGM